MLNRKTSRRRLLKETAAAGLGFWVSARGNPVYPFSPNDKLNIGIIGAGNRGAVNLQAVESESVVALCDVDDQFLGKAADRYPKATKYNDFRRMLEQKDIDAVIVSTADHTHAVASVMAMKLGKHVYCEKPLTHSVHEARVVAEVAAQTKVATQMGIQLHSDSNYRRVVELVQSGAIGGVTEVHAWCKRTGKVLDRPQERTAVPAHLHWDLWLGPAPERPYISAYHPIKWRAWWDFGSGMLGDMGCHLFDPAFWALKLRHPTTIEAEGPPVHSDSAPPWCIVRYGFPAEGNRPALRLIWYHGSKGPPADLTEGEEVQYNGSLFVGNKGKILIEHQGGHKLLPRSKFADFKPPEPFLRKTPGHHADWIAKCKGGGIPECPFDYAGALTETVLLGNVAFRAGRTLEWDAPKLRATNCPEAEALLRREYRKGWAL